jgi:hypothetical protein
VVLTALELTLSPTMAIMKVSLGLVWAISEHTLLNEHHTEHKQQSWIQETLLDPPTTELNGISQCTTVSSKEPGMPCHNPPTKLDTLRMETNIYNSTSDAQTPQTASNAYAIYHTQHYTAPPTKA